MGFAFFTTPCLKFAEGGSAWCMAEFFDVVIRDVELYNSGLGTDTSEPVPTVNSHVDSVVDSLTVWSRTHTGFQNPAHAITLSDGNALHDEISADPPELELLNQHETWTGSQIDRALQEAHFINSRATGQKLPWESGVFATIFDNSDSFLASPLSLCPVPPELDDAQQFDQGAESLPSMPSNVLKRDRTDNVFAHVVKMKREGQSLKEVAHGASVYRLCRLGRSHSQRHGMRWQRTGRYPQRCFRQQITSYCKQKGFNNVGTVLLA